MDVVLRVVVLTAIYLLVLTSVHPGDVLAGIVLSVLLVAAGRRIRPLGPPVGRTAATAARGCARAGRRHAGRPGREHVADGAVVPEPAPHHVRPGDRADPAVRVRRRRRRGGCGSGSPRTRWWSSSTRSAVGCCCTSSTPAIRTRCGPSSCDSYERRQRRVFP